jgi:hypothetical protein
MSYANPTALIVGKSGMLDGRRYTVRGRTVLSTVVDGTKYYWNEFNLVDASGQAITLVYEEGDEGSEWKVFRMFEPLRPMSAQAAAAVRVGNSLEFDGKRAQVSLISESRVAYVEGQPPEGVEIGDVARYFNAEALEKTYVVSWTGEEVEHYCGERISAKRLELSFNLPRGAGGSSSFSKPAAFGSDIPVGQVVRVLAFLGFLGVWIYSQLDDDDYALPPNPPAKQIAPPAPLAEESHGSLLGHAYTLTAHAVVEVDQLGGNFDRHEYTWSDERGGSGLLIRGLTENKDQWTLLAPVTAPAGLTPYDAAALKAGQQTTVTGVPIRVSRLFLSKPISNSSQHLASSDPVKYGFVAVTKDGNWLLARWTESHLELFRGQMVASGEVLKAFAKAR